MVKEKKNIEKSEKKKSSVKPKIEEQIVVDSVETVEQNDNDLNNRINMLFGESNSNIEPEKQYDPEELLEVRKKLMLLLICIVIFCVVMIVTLINPFDFGNSKKDKKEEPETIEKEDKGFPMGPIDITEPTIAELNSFLSFSPNDFQTIDLFPLYENSVLEAKNIPDNIKLFLFKKTEAFANMLDDAKIGEYVQTCDPSGISISKENFDKALAEFFGEVTLGVYGNINYSYFSDDIGTTKVSMNYVDDHYVIKCNSYTDGVAITKYLQQSLNKAIKVEGAIELYQNVVFINQTGVYKDTSFSELITNDANAKFSDYIIKGSLYKYIFIEDGDNYYLSKIEKVVETE